MILELVMTQIILTHDWKGPDLMIFTCLWASSLCKPMLVALKLPKGYPILELLGRVLLNFSDQAVPCVSSMAQLDIYFF